ncbi:MAG: aminoglycoside phosphotransferase family protein, partial [Symbiobacteriaceae bacterium]|nr:aminoglycoside phosphotransferase family protein [Symbiobacteriaceae bacterium]
MGTDLNKDALLEALESMLSKKVTDTEFRSTQLHGGTLGNVRLLTGTAHLGDGAQESFRIVCKTQSKWARPGDEQSWRREYDLYQSDLSRYFTPGMRWPSCYLSDLTDDEIRLWIEYIDGVSGEDLSVEMLEEAAYQLGAFQGRTRSLYATSKSISALGDTGFFSREFSQWHRQKYTTEFLVSEESRLPEHLKQELLSDKIKLVAGKSFEYSCLRSPLGDLPEHLKEMLLDIDERQDELFGMIESLPVVLCHRDFWLENIMVRNGETILIDWDTAGWGYLGEDLVSL